MALAAALGACGSSRAPDQGGQLLSSALQRRTRCVAESYAQGLPAVDSVVDSASLAAAVGALRRQDPPPTGYVLLTLGFDRTGLNVRRDVIEHSTGPLVADSIQRLVFAARRQVDEAEREWGVRLRIDLAERLTMRVGQREICPPVPRDRGIEASMQGFNPAGVRYRRGLRERVVHVQAFVNVAGIVTNAQIVRGELRGSSLEREIAQYLRQFLFDPATVDGVPTAGTITIPMRIPA